MNDKIENWKISVKKYWKPPKKITKKIIKTRNLKKNPQIFKSKEQIKFGNKILRLGSDEIVTVNAKVRYKNSNYSKY